MSWPWRGARSLRFFASTFASSTLVGWSTARGFVGHLSNFDRELLWVWFVGLSSPCLTSRGAVGGMFYEYIISTVWDHIYLLLNALKTSFSYFDKLGSFCLSRLCRLKPIFPAVAAHTKAGKIGTLLLNALKISFSFFDKLGSFCLSSLCPPKTDFSSRSCPY